MSIVKVQGNASGTGTLTIAAPNTNSDVTINLPTVTGGEFVVSNSSGNVGIGTSSPSNKLTVSGTGTVTRLISSNTGVYLGLQTSDNSGNYIGSASGATVFQTNDTERMRIDTSGNLGLGVTPSAWYSSYGTKAFQFAASGALFGLDVSNSDRRVILSNNAYDNTSGNNTYLNTGHATRYQQVSGQHQWYTAPSGTAGNAITFTQAMTLDASGNLLVGATSNGNGYKIYAKNNNTSTTSLVLENNNGGYQVYTQNQELAFFQLNVGERARIDSSGNLLVGTTTTSGITNGASANAHNFLSFEGNVNAQRNNGACFYASKATGYTNSEFHSFYVNGSGVGSITTTGSATAYNTSSDYRLKNTIAPMTGALAKVALLKPCTYKWNADGSDGEGFIAHELAEVVPGCVTGDKDAVDAEGNPKYQGIDTSFLVATLTAAIQELKAIVDAQGAEIAALKGQA